MVAAPYILEAATVSLGGTDYSALATKIELTVKVDEKDVTTFVGDGWKRVIGGLKQGTLKCEFLADPTIDAYLWANLGENVAFTCKADDAAISSTNAEFQGTCLITGTTPISGSPGDEAKQSIDMPTSGAVVRDTTP